MDQITLIRPDDWHTHLRDGTALFTTVADTARRFGRAVVMPNLKPPVTTVAMAEAYRQRILAALPEGLSFQPLMMLYLTDQTPLAEVPRVAKSPHTLGFKLYPAGATTHSEAGVTDIQKIYPVIAAMEQHQVPLLIHGEITDSDIDIFDREKYFIDRVLNKLIQTFPGLKIVLEHITTADAVSFIESASAQVAATITAHHLLLNRNDLLAGGIKPHHYCLPVLKRETHRQALLTAATSGNAKFFLGTDSAPHTQQTKETAVGCAGIYTAHAAIELYAEAFEQVDALNKLEGFASLHGPAFYQQPINTTTITLKRHRWTVPEKRPWGADSVIPFRANQSIHWTLVNV